MQLHIPFVFYHVHFDQISALQSQFSNFAENDVTIVLECVWMRWLPNFRYSPTFFCGNLREMINLQLYSHHFGHSMLQIIQPPS